MLKLPEQLHKKPGDKRVLRLDGVTLVEYRQDYSHPVYEAFVSRHLLAFVLSGEKQVQVGDETMRVRGGEAFFLRRGVYSMSEISLDAGSFSNALFFLEPALIDEFIGPQVVSYDTGAGPAPPFFRLVVTPLVRHFIDSLPVLIADPLAVNAALVRCKLVELLHCLVDAPENDGFRCFLTQLAMAKKNDLVSFMQRHAGSGLGMAQLASLSGRSLSAFKRDFVEIFSEPPGKWQRRRRLDKAFRLLRNDSLTVTQVSQEVGYDSLSHFIRAFRTQFGVTPKAMSRNRQK
jgi:AraC-like DNA-binding protein